MAENVEAGEIKWRVEEKLNIAGTSYHFSYFYENIVITSDKLKV